MKAHPLCAQNPSSVYHSLFAVIYVCHFAIFYPIHTMHSTFRPCQDFGANLKPPCLAPPVLMSMYLSIKAPNSASTALQPLACRLFGTSSIFVQPYVLQLPALHGVDHLWCVAWCQSYTVCVNHMQRVSIIYSA